MDRLTLARLSAEAQDRIGAAIEALDKRRSLTRLVADYRAAGAGIKDPGVRQLRRDEALATFLEALTGFVTDHNEMVAASNTDALIRDAVERAREQWLADTQSDENAAQSVSGGQETAPAPEDDSEVIEPETTPETDAQSEATPTETAPARAVSTRRVAERRLPPPVID